MTGIASQATPLQGPPFALHTVSSPCGTQLHENSGNAAAPGVTKEGTRNVHALRNNSCLERSAVEATEWRYPSSGLFCCLPLGWTLGNSIGHSIQLPNACLNLLEVFSKFSGRRSQHARSRHALSSCPASWCGRAGCLDAKRGVQLNGRLTIQRGVGARR